MGTIHSTTDYSMFSLLSQNRDITKTGNLEAQIARKNMLSAFPIIVNRQHQVIDGQHRLAVAKKLGLAVYYIVDDSVELQDIPLAASCVRRWSLADYLKHYSKIGNKNYKDMQDLLSAFPFITVALALHITPRAGFGNRERWFQSGEFKSTGLHHVRKVLAECQRYKGITAKGLYSKRVFLCTMSRLVKMDWFDCDRMYTKTKNWPNLFTNCVDVPQCLEMLERLYNYKAQNRVSFFTAE